MVDIAMCKGTTFFVSCPGTGGLSSNIMLLDLTIHSNPLSLALLPLRAILQGSAGQGGGAEQGYRVRDKSEFKQKTNT